MKHRKGKKRAGVSGIIEEIEAGRYTVPVDRGSLRPAALFPLALFYILQIPVNTSTHKEYALS